MADESAVMTAPDAGAETLDASTTFDTGIDAGSTGEEHAGGESDQQIDSADEPQAGETGHLRGAELYRAVKDKLRNGEKLSPQELKSIRNAIHIAGKADEATGGDLGKFEATQAVVDQLRFPGEESYTPEQLVEQYKSEREQLYNIFKDIESGAPALIEEIATDHPESFQNLTVQAMDRLANMNNEVFSTYVAKSAFGYLNNKQVPLQFAILETFLPESSNDPGTQRVIDAVNNIKNALRGLGEMAAKPLSLKKPEPKQDASNPQEKSIAEREHNIRRYEWNVEASRPNQQLRDAEIQKVVSSRKAQLTEKERSQVMAAIKDEFDTRISLHANTLKSYVEANNKKAYCDRIASEGKKLLPSIVQRHVNAVLANRTTAAQTSQNGNGQKKTEKPVAQGTTDAKSGVTWLAGSPGSLGLQVDYNRTTQGMLLQNEAYIKGKSGLHKWKARVA
jgi:hypothetical protein